MMKWISQLTFVCLMLAVPVVTDAGLLHNWADTKCCECGEACQPHACAPTIVRPTHARSFCYQRKNHLLKPGCRPAGCAPATCCAPVNACVPQQSCDAISCSPMESTCCEPSDCCIIAESCGCTSECTHSCSCGDNCCTQDRCCEIAKLIQKSRTACYATGRRDAIHRLGDKFDCVCHPEIMSAFVYALNDSDERVRAKSADEIGDQIRRKRCCCGAPVIRALKCALADCDRGVRRQAEEALQLSGYKIVNGRCNNLCDTSYQACTETASHRPEIWSRTQQVSAAVETTGVPPVLPMNGIDAESDQSAAKPSMSESPATAGSEKESMELLSPLADKEDSVDVPQVTLAEQSLRQSESRKPGLFARIIGRKN